MPCLSKVLYLCTNCYYYKLYFSAREWWQFSINCILHSIKERNLRQTWTFAAKRAHDMVKYVNIYTKHLVSATTAEPALKVTQALFGYKLDNSSLRGWCKKGRGMGKGEKKQSPIPLHSFSPSPLSHWTQAREFKIQYGGGSESFSLK